MKPLTEDRVKMTRELEKAERTYEPKGIWVRAWQIMLETHLDEFRKKGKTKVIHWKSKITDVEGQGTVALSDDVAKKWVDKLNIEYPNMIHWIEEVKENENSTDES